MAYRRCHRWGIYAFFSGESTEEPLTHEELHAQMTELLRELKKQKELHGDVPHPATAKALKEVGCAFGIRNDHEQAIKFLKMALEMLKVLHEEKAHIETATVLQAIGDNYLPSKDFRSLTYYEQAWKMRKALGDKGSREDMAALLQHMGKAWVIYNDISRGLRHYEQALAILKELYQEEPHQNRVELLEELGDVYLFNLQDNLGSLTYYEQALAIREKLYGRTLYNKKNEVDLYVTAFLLHKIGAAYANEADFHKSLFYSKKALTIDQKLRSDIIETPTRKTYFNIGIAHYYLGHLQESIKAITCSLRSFRTLPRDKQTGGFDSKCLMVLGKIHRALGEYQKSERFLKEALATSKNKDNSSLLHVELGSLYYAVACSAHKEKDKQKHLYKAHQAFANALKLHESSSKVFMGYVDFLLATQNYARAYTYLIRTIELEEQESLLRYDTTSQAMTAPVVQTQIQEKKLVKIRAMDYAYYLLLLHYDVFLKAGVTPEKSREAYLAAYKSSVEGRENRKSEEKQDAIARLLLSDLEHRMQQHSRIHATSKTSENMPLEVRGE